MSISSYGVLDRQTTNTERWVTFAALFLFGFTASCNLFKASPVMTVIGGARRRRTWPYHDVLFHRCSGYGFPWRFGYA